MVSFCRAIGNLSGVFFQWTNRKHFIQHERRRCMTQNNEQHLPEVINFNYNGNPVSYAINGLIMVNATEMAKPFGKQPADWLKTQRVKEFLDVLSKTKKNRFG
jgi:hypothetical protein